MSVNSDDANLYLQKLCGLSSRRVGSEGNRLATDMFAERVASFGWEVETQSFECLDWRKGEISLHVDGESFECQISPYSLGCDLVAPLYAASTIAELEALELAGNILLLHGELTAEQLMPKNFPFYNPEQHRRIYQLMEERRPAAIIAATGRNPELAGGVYPFPLIEDGDFGIPVAHMTDIEGARLLSYKKPAITLKMDATRIPSQGCNVIARAGLPSHSRVVVCAHIDAKDDTPGAIDNGSGVVVLLLLAQLLAGSSSEMGIELLAVNGEDYYSAPGEVTYLRVRKNELDQVHLAINLDGAGYIEGATEYSLYECPDSLGHIVQNTFSDWDELVEGDQWYQSDHTIFVQNGRPAVAITSAEFMRLSTELTHTPDDKPEIVDPDKLVRISHAIRALIANLAES